MKDPLRMMLSWLDKFFGISTRLSSALWYLCGRAVQFCEKSKIYESLVFVGHFLFFPAHTTDTSLDASVGRVHIATKSCSTHERWREEGPKGPVYFHLPKCHQAHRLGLALQSFCIARICLLGVALGWRRSAALGRTLGALTRSTWPCARLSASWMCSALLDFVRRLDVAPPGPPLSCRPGLRQWQ